MLLTAGHCFGLNNGIGDGWSTDIDGNEIASVGIVDASAYNESDAEAIKLDAETIRLYDQLWRAPENLVYIDGDRPAASIQRGAWTPISHAGAVPPVSAAFGLGRDAIAAGFLGGLTVRWSSHA